MPPLFRRSLPVRRVLLRALLIVFVNAALGGCGDSSEMSTRGPGGGLGEGGGGGMQSGGAGGEPIIEAVPCEDVLIVNLNPDPDDAGSCAGGSTIEDVADCIAEEIDEAFELGCQQSFDVFVPGTAAEYGAWKQFNSMFSRDTGRGYLSLQYASAAGAETIENTFDAAQYDKGVIDATSSLTLLLYALQNRFVGSDVRIFGHSKGSHAVSLVSDFPEFAAMQFYAFAQPGRTETDISERNDIAAGKRGRPGRIEKLSANLVGITWENDEVRYYRGSGTNGLPIPERWSYPGYISQNTYDGGNPFSFRIDHHNNYGGSYLDGVSSNEWRAGQGTTKPNYPYCATGNSLFGSYAECEKQLVAYVPYFWANEDCRELAFDLMANGDVDDSHYIGQSGPRDRGCTEDNSTLEAEYVMVYRINNGDLNDDDCRIDLEVGFEGLDNRTDGGSISVRTSVNEDTGWLIDQGTVRVPVHMRVRMTMRITDTSGGIRDCGGLSVAQTESYIQTLRLNFTHPEQGVRIDRTVIGLEEGGTATPFPASLARQNNVAWYEDINNVDADIHYAPTRNAIMIKSDTDGGVRGTFYKRLHLLD